MATSTQEWIDELKGISVLELAERIKALEEEFGVSAQAVAAAAPADGDAPDEGTTPHSEEPAEGADDETAEPEAEAPADEPAAEAEADAGDEATSDNENEADASA